MHRGDLEAAMQGLIALLRRANTALEAKYQWRIFFDGKRRRGDETRQIDEAGLQVYFSHDLSADFLIQQFVRQYSTPADLKVVSSDKKLQESLRKFKVRRQSSEEFAAWLQGVLEAGVPAAPEKPERAPDAAEVDYWRRMFSRRSQS